MWDIVGKALDRPVYDLLGGRMHERLPAYANAWYGQAKTPASGRRRPPPSPPRATAGSSSIPFGDCGRDPTAAEVRRSVELVQAVRQGVGPDVDVLIDAHGRFSVGAAIDICRSSTPAGSTGWKSRSTPTITARWRRSAGHPAEARHGRALHEPLPAAVAPRHQRGGRAAARPHPCRRHHGGQEDRRHRGCCLHPRVVPQSFGPVATAAAIQLDACTSNFVMQESFCEYDVEMRFDLLDHAPRPVGGHYDIPDRPASAWANSGRGGAGLSVRQGRLPAALPARLGDAVLTMARLRLVASGDYLHTMGPDRPSDLGFDVFREVPGRWSCCRPRPQSEAVTAAALAGADGLLLLGQYLTEASVAPVADRLADRRARRRRRRQDRHRRAHAARHPAVQRARGLDRGHGRRCAGADAGRQPACRRDGPADP